MRQRLLLFSAATLALAAGSAASAQDWTGWYLGGNIGGAWADTKVDTTVTPGSGPVVIPPIAITALNTPTSDDDNDSGFTAGIEGGYNYQSGAWVWGIESDWGAFDLDQDKSKSYTTALIPPTTYNLSQQVTTGWVWTLRPRVGFASGPWLFYGTIGAASTEVELTTTYTDTRTPTAGRAQISESDTKWGWAGGLGGAYLFGANWSLKGEWIYADFGDISQTVTSTDNFVSLTSSAQVRANTVRLGLDYKF
jgi:outer membrane immunogenic protein